MILRNFTRNVLKFNRSHNLKSLPVEYAVCVDVECTCDSPVQIYQQEIIEIACTKLDLTSHTRILTQDDITKTLEKCPTFHSFVRPVENPNLTDFCQELTGIMQSTVDNAPTINVVLTNLTKWLKDVDLIDDKIKNKREFAFASCGNFDQKMLSSVMNEFLVNSSLELPIYFKEWINVKKTYFNHKGEWPRGLYHMLELLDLEPSGRLHSAEDDCKNLACVVEYLHRDGCKFYKRGKVN